MVYFTTSWDDGNKLDLKVANLLEEYEFKGTFYIPIKWKFKSLSEKDLKEISKKFEIGSHGLSHKKLTTLNAREAETELVSSKKILEKLLKKPVDSYAYPFGIFNKISAEYVKKSGYKFARTSQEFSMKPGNPFMSKITVRAENNFSKILYPKFFHLLVKSGFRWNKLAKIILNNCNHNSVFHLAGHSNNLKKENFEEELIDFFDFVEKLDIIPIANSEILKIFNQKIKVGRPGFGPGLPPFC